MKLKIEVVVDADSRSQYALRTATLLGLMAQALRDEVWSGGPVVVNIDVGTESIKLHAAVLPKPGEVSVPLSTIRGYCDDRDRRAG